MPEPDVSHTACGVGPVPPHHCSWGGRFAGLIIRLKCQMGEPPVTVKLFPTGSSLSTFALSKPLLRPPQGKLLAGPSKQGLPLSFHVHMNLVTMLMTKAQNHPGALL